MKESDFPGVYQAANKLAREAQTSFFAALILNLAFLVAAAVVSFINYPHWISAVIQAVLLAGSLLASLYLALARPERLWYSGRAVAESIKTLVWRYVSRAEPFHEIDDSDAKASFLKKLQQVIDQNTRVSDKFASAAKLISPQMKQMRSANLERRRDIYVEFRISDQLNWYSTKANFNKRASKIYFSVLILTNALAFVCALVKIANVEYRYFPTDVLIAIAAGLLVWMQAKRYSELSASYSLAVHEIAIIREQADEVDSDNGLSRFVGDAENAFSREHTQWVARKDN